nr:CapA family protein [Nakamurella aerolata]
MTTASASAAPKSPATVDSARYRQPTPADVEATPATPAAPAPGQTGNTDANPTAANSAPSKAKAPSRSQSKAPAAKGPASKTAANKGANNASASKAAASKAAANKAAASKAAANKAADKAANKAPTKAADQAANPPLKRSQAPAPSIQLAFTGDMLTHDRIIKQAASDARAARRPGYAFDRMLSSVAPVVSSADFAVCHQETVIAGPSNERVGGYPSFRAPYELAAAEKAAGWDACSTASNHTTDHGQSGVNETLDALDANGIQHTGSYRSAEEEATQTVYDVNGVLVGHLSMTYGNNSGASPNPWSVDKINVEWAKEQAAQMKSRGVDIVVASVHDGVEQQQEPSPEQRTTDAALLSSPDIDLVIGAHAHVVQPISQVADGRYIVYGLGNFLAIQSSSSTASDAEAGINRDGIVVLPTFTKGNDGRYRVTQMGYVPTFVTLDGYRVELAPERSRERVSQIVNSGGAKVQDLTDSFR